MAKDWLQGTGTSLGERESGGRLRLLKGHIDSRPQFHRGVHPQRERVMLAEA